MSRMNKNVRPQVNVHLYKVIGVTLSVLHFNHAATVRVVDKEAFDMERYAKSVEVTWRGVLRHIVSAQQQGYFCDEEAQLTK